MEGGGRAGGRGSGNENILEGHKFVLTMQKL